jgi:hypothetical protein
MAHGDCFVQGKALAPIPGGQDVIARTLTNVERKTGLLTWVAWTLTSVLRIFFTYLSNSYKSLITTHLT